ncbi:MAG: hypothetical protein WCZ27_02335 [Tissierellaceae bacterium]
MLKRILASLVIGVAIFAIGSITYATDTIEKGLIDKSKIEQSIIEQIRTDQGKIDDIKETKLENEIDPSKYQIIRPEKDAYTIEEKVDFVNGIAPADTTVTIEIYGTTDLTRKSFNLLKLPSEDDYIEVLSDIILVGNSGTFSKQLELVTGINKVVITFDADELPPIEIIIFVNPNNSTTNREMKRPEKLLEMIIQN